MSSELPAILDALPCIELVFDRERLILTDFRSFSWEYRDVTELPRVIFRTRFCFIMLDFSEAFPP